MTRGVGIDPEVAEITRAGLQAYASDGVRSGVVGARHTSRWTVLTVAGVVSVDRACGVLGKSSDSLSGHFIRCMQEHNTVCMSIM